MSDKCEATPRPWKVERATGVYIDCGDSCHCLKAVPPIGACYDDVDTENIALACLAVNAYDDLVAVAEELIKADKCDGEGFPAYALELAVRALAKHKPETTT